MLHAAFGCKHLSVLSWQWHRCWSTSLQRGPGRWPNVEDRKVGLPEGLASIDLTYSFYPQTLVAPSCQHFWSRDVSFFNVYPWILSASLWKRKLPQCNLQLHAGFTQIHQNATFRTNLLVTHVRLFRCPFQSTASMEPSAAMFQSKSMSSGRYVIKQTGCLLSLPASRSLLAWSTFCLCAALRVPILKNLSHTCWHNFLNLDSFA